eukprot:CAMPEP_0114127500 /NCGR_PEP_ID=MMETSP0043_2-20121206/10412_1 /TAXON_ID=464988 /ORGANISM="Hemiselmis andersenii, Strain CCMP644" /LENGTH=284 /DNA_ID=CAMNT_0001220587 /DNA_START=16 /DNA_END=867 /DNA_ORIENTATION=+
MTKEERQNQKIKRQEEVMRAIGRASVTEKCVLEKVGDSRYTREILRRLLAQGIVNRKGKGGSNDPFLYTINTCHLNCDGGLAETPNLVDPGLEVRLKRIEAKITELLIAQKDCTTEKFIRMVVGDNTGTGKAIRRLVSNGRVLRVGKGGVGDPYRYRLEACFGGAEGGDPQGAIDLEGGDCLSTSPSGGSSPTHHHHEEEVLSLHHSLRSDDQLIEVSKLLDASGLFGDSDGQMLLALAKTAKLTCGFKGDVLVEEGLDVAALHVVAGGHIALCSENREWSERE